MPTLLMTHISVPWHPAIFTHTQKQGESTHSLTSRLCKNQPCDLKLFFCTVPATIFIESVMKMYFKIYFTCIPLCRCRLAWRGRPSHLGYTQHNPPLGAHHRLQAYKYGALCSTSNQIDTRFLLAPEAHSQSHNCSRAEKVKISYTQKYHPFPLCY